MSNRTITATISAHETWHFSAREVRDGIEERKSKGAHNKALRTGISTTFKLRRQKLL